MSRKFDKLNAIMKRLRSKKGCPWDKKQTHKTLTPYIIEEAYEVIEAINNNDDKALREELGDLLLQVVFQAEIARGNKKFTIDDVIEGINTKLTVRHPHVFGSRTDITKSAHVMAFWEKYKKETKKRDSVIDGVPAAMPALLRGRRIVSKAQTTGFKWKTNAGVLAKVDEELLELKAALKTGKKKHAEEEIGDLIFTLISLAYNNKINPEDALQMANNKFIKRFKKIEKHLKPGMNEKDMLDLWKKSK